MPWPGCAGRKITTYEILDEKAVLARQTFAATEVSDVVEFVHGDALDHLTGGQDVAFSTLDAEKEICMGVVIEAVIPRMVPGGILVADNANQCSVCIAAYARAVTVRTERMGSLMIVPNCAIRRVDLQKK